MSSEDQSGNTLTEIDLKVNKETFFITETISALVNKLNAMNEKDLLIVHLNIRSLRKHWEEFNIHLKEHLGTIDVIILTEISIHENENPLYKIEGYASEFYNRVNIKGGGIAIYVKNDIQYSILRKEQNSISMHESMYCVLNFKGDKINILVIYRPPDTNKDKFLRELEKDLGTCNERENLILVGDINIDTNKIYDQYKNKYEDILSMQGMEECIFADTRVVIRDGVLTRSKIDHIYARVKSKTISSVIELNISDHFAIAINMLVSLKDKYIDNWVSNTEHNTRYNEFKLRNALKSIKWEGDIKSNDTLELYKLICCKFENVYNNPQNRQLNDTLMKVRVSKCWITNELIKRIKERDKAFKKWKSTPTNADYREEYNVLRNKLNKDIKKQKNKFYSKKIEMNKNNMKKLWNEINCMIGRKKVNNIDEVIKNFLGKKHNVSEILTGFANEFSLGVENKIHNCNITTCDNMIENNIDLSIYIPKIKECNVLSIIESMKDSKSPGIDLIRAKDIKYCKKQIASLLVTLINSSIQSGIIPQRLKTSIIRPIYKGGVHTEFTNYRPIAILPAIEKIMEKYISSKLNKYLREHTIINEEQHGFQKGKSTISLLENFSNYINCKLNTNKIILIIFIDLTKAFDTIDHNILIKRLEMVGIRGNLLNWFKHYLQERKIRVRIGTKFSESREIHTGIPQGSILGPILYTIYVNPLFKNLKHSKIYMYADDTALVIANNNKEEAERLLQEDFNVLQRWIHDNKLIINDRKTKILCIKTPKRKDEPVHIQCHNNTCLHNGVRDNNMCNCPELVEVLKFKYLGMYVDNKFNWNVQVEDICKKLRACAAQFYKLKFILDYRQLKMVYCGLVQSIVRYGIQCYGSTTVTNKIKIERLHNKIVKMIKNKNYTQDMTDILTFNGLYKYTMVIEYYYNNELRKIVDNEYNIRKKRFIIPLTFNKYGDRQLEVVIPKIFNEIPENLQKLTHISAVKKEIKTFLLDLENK